MHYNEVHHSTKSTLPWNLDKNWYTKVRGSGEKRMMEHCIKTGTIPPCRKQARYLSKKDQISIATHFVKEKNYLEWVRGRLGHATAGRFSDGNMCLKWIETFHSDLGGKTYNHLKIGNGRTKVGLLDYNSLLPDAKNIELDAYFSIHNYIASNQCDGMHLLMTNDKETVKGTNTMIKKLCNSSGNSATTEPATTHSFKNSAINDLRMYSGISERDVNLRAGMSSSGR